MASLLEILCRDIIARFGADPTYKLPQEFFDDFVRVRVPHTLQSTQAGDTSRFACNTSEHKTRGAGTLLIP